tara:strand:+ start:343 stop:858 length:516 start_codon:yes stop_codon:yes gene_type:complete
MAKQKTTKTTDRPSNRRSKWTHGVGFERMRNAIYLYRAKGLQLQSIFKKYQIPPRTLRRYLHDSKHNKDSIFYLAATKFEKEQQKLTDSMVNEIDTSTISTNHLQQHLLKKLWLDVVNVQPHDVFNTTYYCDEDTIHDHSTLAYSWKDAMISPEINNSDIIEEMEKCILMC